MLPNTPAASTLLSSESLNVVTSSAHSVGAEESECESGAENESDRDGEEDDDDSDDDLQIVFEQSGTTDSTGASSAGTEAPAKKAKMTRPVVVQCLDRGGRGGMVEGVGVWYVYEITLWLHAGNLLRHTFRNH
jgi:hypothetical protein